MGGRTRASATPARSRLRAAILDGLVGALIAGLLACPATARAERGELIQRPGTDGCIRQGGGEDCGSADVLFGSFAVALTVDGRNAYVALADGQGVAALARSRTTGALTQLPSPAGCTSQTGSGGLCATGRGLHAAIALTVSPDGKHVYVVSQQRDPVTLSSIALFTRDASTGALTQLPGAQGCLSEVLPECTPAIAIRNATSIALSRDGRHAYVAATTDAVAVFERDAATGLLTQLPEPLGCISQSGSGGHCTQGKTLDGARAVAVSKDGRFVYVASEQSHAVAVFARNRGTGVLTQPPGEEGCIAENGSVEQCTDAVGLGAPTALATRPNDKSVYVVSDATHELALLTRSRKTGALSSMGCIKDDGSVICESAVALRQPFSVTVSPDGRNVYVATRDDNAVAVFARDRKTGRLTQLATPAGCISDSGSEGLCTDGRALRHPRSITFSKNGRQLYVATQVSAGVAVLTRRR